MPIRSDANPHPVVLGRPQRRAIVRGQRILCPNPETVKRASGARHDGVALLTRALQGNAPSRGAGVEIAAAVASDSLNRQNSRFLWRGVLRVMLDKVDGDMVHPP
jgi:hypothetical protein